MFNSFCRAKPVYPAQMDGKAEWFCQAKAVAMALKMSNFDIIKEVIGEWRASR